MTPNLDKQKKTSSEKSPHDNRDTAIGCLIMIAIAFGIGSCFFSSSDEPSPPPVSSASSSSSQESSSPPAVASLPDKISESPSIGSTADAFSKSHKISHDNDMMKVYDGTHISVVFADGRALNVTVNADKNHKRDQSFKEMLPSDAVSIAKSNDNSDSMLSKTIESYHSDSLEQVIPDSKGAFKVIETFDKESGNYLHSVIDASPSI